MSAWCAPGTESGSSFFDYSCCVWKMKSFGFTFFGRCIENRGLKTQKNPIMSQMHLDSDQDSNTTNPHAKYSPD